jgi:hypothetical protein
MVSELLLHRSRLHGAPALAAEVAVLAILVAGVVALSHIRLITGEEHAGLQSDVDGHAQAPGGLAAHES